MLEWVFVLGVFCGVCGIGCKKKHFLRVVLLLEVAALSLFVGGMLGFGFFGACEASLVILAVSACEAAVGLGILTTFVRVNGNDRSESMLFIKV